MRETRAVNSILVQCRPTLSWENFCQRILSPRTNLRMLSHAGTLTRTGLTLSTMQLTLSVHSQRSMTRNPTNVISYETSSMLRAIARDHLPGHQAKMLVHTCPTSRLERQKRPQCIQSSSQAIIVSHRRGSNKRQRRLIMVPVHRRCSKLHKIELTRTKSALWTRSNPCYKKLT